MNGYKMSEEEKENFYKKQDVILHRTQLYDSYSSFTEQQKENFLKTVEEILEEIEKLIIQGKVYINTRAIARIKDPESVINNDDYKQEESLMSEIMSEISENKGDYIITETNQKVKEETDKTKKWKSLDDIFGLSIITDTQEEIDYIIKQIKNKFKIEKEKNHTKDKYKATHLYLWKEDINDEEQKNPLIEIQLKTNDQDRESYDHTLYKVEQALKKEKEHISKVVITEKGKEKIINIIQKFYNDNKFSIFNNIPRMWEARYNEELEKMEIKQLGETQTLKRMYHYLATKSVREQNIRGES